MGIKVFVSEFQDHLFNKLPMYDRLDVNRASKSDYYGVHRNTQDILEEYKESLDFLETNALAVDEELLTILNSLENKLDKIDTFSNSIIGLNSTDRDGKSILSINPYTLSDSLNWEQMQRTYMLPIKSTYRTLDAYTVSTNEGKATARYLIDDKVSTKYLNIKKKHTTQIVAVTCLNDAKDVLISQNVTNSVNKTSITVEIPSMSRYILLEYYFEDEEELTITPLTFKHTQHNKESLDTKEFQYGSLLSYNASTDIPRGCYVRLELECSFRDINNKEVAFRSIKLPINTDGFCIDPYREYTKGVVKGFWLEGSYTEDNLDNIPEEALVVYKPAQEEGVEVFTEATLKLNIPKAKNIVVAARIVMTSAATDNLTPRLNYLTGITKDV